MSHETETAPVDLSAVDPAMRVKALIALTQELTSIFTQENDSLRERRPADMAPLQADKARLAAAYAQSIRQVAQDRSLVDGAGDGLLEQLKEITRTFESRANEQRALLSGAQAASEGVLRAVADEAEAAASTSAYNNPSERNSAANATPITLNEEV